MISASRPLAAGLQPIAFMTLAKSIGSLLLGGLLALGGCGGGDLDADPGKVAPTAAALGSAEQAVTGAVERKSTSAIPTVVVPGEPKEDCYGSKYNCNIHGGYTFRVTNADTTTCNSIDGDSESGACAQWQVNEGQVRDGFGNWTGGPSGGGVVYPSQQVFNWGQVRDFPGLGTYAFDMTAGWFPISSIVDASLFNDRVGRFYARNPGLGYRGCFKTSAPYPLGGEQKAFEHLRIFPDLPWSTPSNEDVAANYLPGGAEGFENMTMALYATDLVRRGTLFRRLNVPTYSQPWEGDKLEGDDDSLRFPLYHTHSHTQVGWLVFYYGFVPTRAVLGYDSIGWLAARMKVDGQTYEYLSDESDSACPTVPIEQPEE
jgi:hypothetical protein